MKTMMIIVFSVLMVGCTGSVIRSTAVPNLEPPVATAVVATPEAEKPEDSVVSAIYNGEARSPHGEINSIPYWVMENGEAKAEHLYFKPLYIVVN